MKKLINDPANVVVETLRGIEAAHGDLLRVHYDPNYIVRQDAPVANKVGVLSGGGSGHEPLHGSFVGRGMLDAACPGATFTSPTPDQMLAATKAIDSGKGVLHIAATCNWHYGRSTARAACPSAGRARDAYKPRRARGACPSTLFRARL